ncbi:hypothetical protein PR202_ga16800 [Eleusine coracana subsp. coracana]|uniref:Uncharacterized protein n=1 Tax=Eleusine coracana subsp. coracana TaxID=191504 RepID=A0AAV5CP61_ELECO|nr:hypothetical protein PR202_ga16800 [Eleusine coracana subsp. coracana]
MILVPSRIAVVTGGNKGIGLEVCCQLAANGITVVLTARDEKRGSEAVEKLQKAGLSEIIFYQLDVTDAPNIGRLADFIKARFGKLDILVNNAAVIGVEYIHDPVDLFNNEELKQELNDVENLTEERLDEVLARFLKHFEVGAVESQGCPVAFSAYKVAMTAMNAYSRILARRHPELRVNCAHPGFVKTDITRNSGLLPPAGGAGYVTKVALLPAGGPTGVYFTLGAEASFF